MRRHFPVVTQLIPHALFYNSQFSIRWLALSTNFLKPYQKSLILTEGLSEELSAKLQSDVSFYAFSANLSFLVFQ